MYEAMRPSTDGGGDSASLSVDDLVRLWLHEALRLFQDRLVYAEEREWTDRTIDAVARKHFPQVDHNVALARPVLFSNWLTKHYTSVGQSALREHVKTRLRVFYEEELDVKLVIFDEVLEHILRIDRVLRQPLGHLLLVGASGAGKTILSKFVSWMQGMSVFQVSHANTHSCMLRLIPELPANRSLFFFFLSFAFLLFISRSSDQGAQALQREGLRQGSSLRADARRLQERAHLLHLRRSDTRTHTSTENAAGGAFTAMRRMLCACACAHRISPLPCRVRCLSVQSRTC